MNVATAYEFMKRPLEMMYAIPFLQNRFRRTYIGALLVLMSPASTAQLVPLVECIEPAGTAENPTYIAHMGYLNLGLPRFLPPGVSANRFFPDPGDRGQPVEFMTGYFRRSLTVEVPVNEVLIWNLDGLSIEFSFDETIRCDALFPTTCEGIHKDGFEACEAPVIESSPLLFRLPAITD